MPWIMGPIGRMVSSSGASGSRLGVVALMAKPSVGSRPGTTSSVLGGQEDHGQARW
jgi:hypothetical protein